MPMDLEEANNVFGMNEGCPEHGAEHMTECTACGAESIRRRIPRSAVCADCAEGGSLDNAVGTGEFSDADKLDRLLDDDKAAPGAAGDEDENP